MCLRVAPPTSIPWLLLGTSEEEIDRNGRLTSRYSLRSPPTPQESSILFDCCIDLGSWHRGKHGHLQYGRLAGTAVAAHQGPETNAFSGLFRVRGKFRTPIFLPGVYRDSEADCERFFFARPACGDPSRRIANPAHRCRSVRAKSSQCANG